MPCSGALTARTRHCFLVFEESDTPQYLSLFFEKKDLTLTQNIKTMKEITLRVEEHHFDILLQFLKSLTYVEVETKEELAKNTVVELEPMTKEEALTGFAGSVRDANAAMRGEIKLPSIYDVLDEIEAK